LIVTAGKQLAMTLVNAGRMPQLSSWLILAESKTGHRRDNTDSIG
jgi:hypothetical protein